MGMMRAGLTAENYDRGYTNRELFARIGSYFRPQGRRLASVMLLVSALSLSGALLPVLMAQGVNVVTGVAANREAIAAALVVLVIAIGVLNWGINWARRMLTARLLGDVVLSMRVDAFRAVMNHDMSFFDKNQSGR